MKVLSFHLTDLCNSKCTFCVVASPLYEKNSIDYAGVVNFLTKNAGKGYDAVNIHGGEATIHPKFIETLSLIQQLGYPEVHLQTNGIRLADKAFVADIVRLGVTLFIVSLHGSTAALHDSLTHTPGGFDKTIHGLRNAKDMGSRLRTNTVITRQNMADLRDVTQVACDIGVNHINYSNLHPVGSSMFALSRTLPKLKELYPFLCDAVSYARSQSRRVTIEGFPLCAVPDLTQLHLTKEYRRVVMLMRGQILDDYDSFMSSRMRSLGPPCGDCPGRGACGGVYPEYIDHYGWSEFSRLVDYPATVCETA